MINSLELITFAKFDLNCKIGRRWARITGFENEYQISDDGLVRSIGRRAAGFTFNTHLITQNKTSRGGPRVSLWKNGKETGAIVGRLVANAFVPNPDNLPCVIHKNHITNNNYYLNLVWSTRTQATHHARLPLGESHPGAKVTKSIVLDMRKDFIKGLTVQQISKKYKHSSGAVSAICSNKTWKHIK